VTEMRLVRCGVGASKCYLDDFEASNREFIRERNENVLCCDRVQMSSVARLLLLSKFLVQIFARRPGT
jgi:hypothetical protein